MKKTRDEGLNIHTVAKHMNADDAALRKFKALLRKIQIEEPRSEDAHALRRLLESTPGLWRVLGDLANVSIQAALQSRTIPPVMRISVEAGIEDLRKENGYEEAPGLERMLIDQILVSWLQLQTAQISYEGVMRNAVTIDNAKSWERRLSASHARYLRACETLARVRKLSRPSAVQVNIAKQQVNVAQTGDAQRQEANSGEQGHPGVRRALPPPKGE